MKAKEHTMKTKHNIIVRFLFTSVLLVVLLTSSCAPGQFLAPTMTPTLTMTPSATITPTQTSTPTATFTPTKTLTPTLTSGQILDEAIAIACQGKPATSPEVGSSTDQPGAGLCPGVDKIMLPQEWIANTAGNLRYVIDIEMGVTPDRSCAYEGGFTVRLQRPFQKIVVYNSMTGAVVQQLKISGPDSYCPPVFKVGGSNDLTGDYASWGVVEKEMIDLLRSMLPALKVEPASVISHPDLTGTVWNATDSIGDHYVLEFLTGGILKSSYSNGTNANGAWEQNGNSVSFSLNDNYVIYDGVIRSNSMRGTAINKIKFTWTWSAEIQE